jgi:Ser-tRNA(Ala) deacylase AlaX
MEILPAYERDPRQRERAANVLRTGATDGTSWAVLDDTVLYPEGGGQPADHGWVGDVAVLDVRREDGEIRHCTASPVALGPTRLRLDWSRRFDHMQQHTAQHLLTAVALTRFGWRTTAFHLGPDRADIEVDVATPTAGQLRELEDAVAAEVRAAHPVTTRRVSPEEAAALPIRSRGLPAGHHGSIRLVAIGDDGRIDLNTCGGTHLSSTGEIESLALIGQESMRGGTRLFWVAGGRVRARLAAHEARAAGWRRLFDASDDEAPAVAAAKLEQLRDTERARRRLLDRLATAEAERLLAAGRPLVEAHYQDDDAAFLQLVARRIGTSPAATLALLTAGEAPNAAFALALGGGRQVDLRAAGALASELLGGRGGGSGQVFQGRAASLARRNDLLAALQQA